MTIEQASKLTPEEVRVKIAEACGWKHIDKRHDFIVGRSFFSSPRDIGGTPPNDPAEIEEDEAYERLPDYFHDLNACAGMIDLLAECGWRCNLANGLDKTWECELMRPPTTTTDPDCVTEIRGETFEVIYSPADKLTHAIYLAFLVATQP